MTTFRLVVLEPAERDTVSVVDVLESDYSDIMRATRSLVGIFKRRHSGPVAGLTFDVTAVAEGC